MGVFDTMIGQAMSAVGKSAVYDPSGSATSLYVMPSQDDQVVGFGETQILADSSVFEARVSDLAAPEDGNILRVGGVDYTIKTHRYLDDDRLIWLLTCYEG